MKACRNLFLLINLVLTTGSVEYQPQDGITDTFNINDDYYFLSSFQGNINYVSRNNHSILIGFQVQGSSLIITNACGYHISFINLNPSELLVCGYTISTLNDKIEETSRFHRQIITNEYEITFEDLESALRCKAIREASSPSTSSADNKSPKERMISTPILTRPQSDNDIFMLHTENHHEFPNTPPCAQGKSPSSLSSSSNGNKTIMFSLYKRGMPKIFCIFKYQMNILYEEYLWSIIGIIAEPVTLPMPPVPVPTVEVVNTFSDRNVSIHGVNRSSSHLKYHYHQSHTHQHPSSGIEQGIVFMHDFLIIFLINFLFLFYFVIQLIGNYCYL